MPKAKKGKKGKKSEDAHNGKEPSESTSHSGQSSESVQNSTSLPKDVNDLNTLINSPTNQQITPYDERELQSYLSSQGFLTSQDLLDTEYLLNLLDGCPVDNASKVDEFSPGEDKELGFADPQLKNSIRTQTSKYRVAVANAWVKNNYEHHLFNEAEYLKTKSGDEMIQVLGKKLNAAKLLSQAENGGRETLELRSLEAELILSVISALQEERNNMSDELDYMVDAEKEWNRSRAQYVSINELYSEKLNNAFELVNSKRLQVYGTAFKDIPQGQNLALLAAERDYLKSRVEFVELERLTLSHMNISLEKLSGYLRQALTHVVGSGNKQLPECPDSLSWANYLKLFESTEEMLAKKFEESYRAELEKDAAERVMSNYQARLFLMALIKEVGQSKGYKELMKLMRDHFPGTIADILVYGSSYLNRILVREGELVGVEVDWDEVQQERFAKNFGNGYDFSLNIPPISNLFLPSKTLNLSEHCLSDFCSRYPSIVDMKVHRGPLKTRNTTTQNPWKTPDRSTKDIQSNLNTTNSTILPNQDPSNLDTGSNHNPPVDKTLDNTVRSKSISDNPIYLDQDPEFRSYLVAEVENIKYEKDKAQERVHKQLTQIEEEVEKTRRANIATQNLITRLRAEKDAGKQEIKKRHAFANKLLSSLPDAKLTLFGPDLKSPAARNIVEVEKMIESSVKKLAMERGRQREPEVPDLLVEVENFCERFIKNFPEQTANYNRVPPADILGRLAFIGHGLKGAVKARGDAIKQVARLREQLTTKDLELSKMEEVVSLRIAEKTEALRKQLATKEKELSVKVAESLQDLELRGIDHEKHSKAMQAKEAEIAQLTTEAKKWRNNIEKVRQQAKKEIQGVTASLTQQTNLLDSKTTAFDIMGADYQATQAALEGAKVELAEVKEFSAQLKSTCGMQDAELARLRSERTTTKMFQDTVEKAVEKAVQDVHSFYRAEITTLQSKTQQLEASNTQLVAANKIAVEKAAQDVHSSYRAEITTLQSKTQQLEASNTQLVAANKIAVEKAAQDVHSSYRAEITTLQSKTQQLEASNTQLVAANKIAVEKAAQDVHLFYQAEITTLQSKIQQLEALNTQLVAANKIAVEKAAQDVHLFYQAEITTLQSKIQQLEALNTQLVAANKIAVEKAISATTTSQVDIVNDLLSQTEILHAEKKQQGVEKSATDATTYEQTLLGLQSRIDKLESENRGRSQGAEGGQFKGEESGQRNMEVIISKAVFEATIEMLAKNVAELQKELTKEKGKAAAAAAILTADN